jgi:lipid-A-disaccharide synthase-like uncharacterized protein
MATFFLISVFGGFLKFIYALKNDEIEILDIIALIYSVVILVAAIIYYFSTGINIFSEGFL